MRRTTGGGKNVREGTGAVQGPVVPQDQVAEQGPVGEQDPVAREVSGQGDEVTTGPEASDEGGPHRPGVGGGGALTHT